jgi:pimeloyl-ACP methyl ester carboxylesterase
MNSQPDVAEHDRPAAAADVRRRLLAGIAVTDRRLHLAGVSTAVLQGGDGPPIVLLHGPGGYAAHWIRVIPDLVTTHRVVAPDLPDHGGSHVVHGNLDTDHVLAWLDALIERTCPTPPVLVGHLLGGAIAARFAKQHGDRLAQLVLVNTFGLGPFEPTPDFGLALQNYLAQPTEDTHDRFWQRCSFNLDSVREQLGQRWALLAAYNLDRIRTPRVQAALGSLMAQLGFAAIPPAALAGIAVPTTLIWGRHDQATPLPIAEAANANYGWPLHVIDDAADDPALDQPEAFVRALRSTLSNSKQEAT